MNVHEICRVFDLGAPTGPPSYVARGELGRVSRLATATGEWALKEIELFVPTVAEADANVELQETMLAVGVNLPRPRRTVDGHGLYGNVRVYEWRDLRPVPVGDVEVEEQVAASLALMHLTRAAHGSDARPVVPRDIVPRRVAGTPRGGSRHMVGADGRRARQRAGRHPTT